MSKIDANVFDPGSELLISEEHRPHWAQSGTVTFITMRLIDSIPREVIQRWHRERIDLLVRHGIECGRDWKTGREQLDPASRKAFDKHFDRARETTLDESIGKCELANPVAAEEVAKSLMHFDDDRYAMGDFVIMPNHLHCLVVFGDADRMRKQCGEWMRYTARKINQLLGRSGPLWYEEPFDHLVRSEDQLQYLRKYLADNPAKANLKPGQSLYRRSPGGF